MKFHLKHPTHLETFLKFSFLLLVLLGYFAYLSWKFDIATGGMVAGLTWSFFVLCTPVADAGFLLDFPTRLIFGLRMIVIEIFVWIIAAAINIIVILYNPAIYEKTFLTSLFYKILTHPWPYWGIILLCAAGTFLSIYFGDEMMDVVSHKERNQSHRHSFKHKMIFMTGLFLIIFIAYKHLISGLGITLPL